jgi:hypothetical protein
VENHRDQTLQSNRPHPESARHYYYRPKGKKTGQGLSLTPDAIRRHHSRVEGERWTQWKYARQMAHNGRAGLRLWLFSLVSMAVAAGPKRGWGTSGLPHLASQSAALVPADVQDKISDSYRLYLSFRSVLTTL